MAQIYPVGLQLVERLYDKLVALYPPVRDWLRLTAAMREESNYYRYGTVRLELISLIVPAFTWTDVTGLGFNIPGLRAGMAFHITPPIAFHAAYPQILWNVMVKSDSYAPDQTQYDPTTAVVIRLFNVSAAPITIYSDSYWQYMGVISRSLNGTDPDTGQQLPISATAAG